MSRSAARRTIRASKPFHRSAGTRRTGAARAVAPSGGRLVSLVDGKEYSVPDTGLVIGRDAGCDVVVPRNEVSRRHAELAVTEDGYVVRDTSSNGVYVNGERIQGSHRLARADVIRVGGEEFRFYADVLHPTPTSPSTPPRRASSFAPIPPHPRSPTPCSTRASSRRRGAARGARGAERRAVQRNPLCDSYAACPGRARGEQ